MGKRTQECPTETEAWDDVSGVSLAHNAVQQARVEDTRWFKNNIVYQKLSRAEDKRRGLQVLNVRWIDINKGYDEASVNRSWLVAEEFRAEGEDDLLMQQDVEDDMAAFIVQPKSHNVNYVKRSPNAASNNQRKGQNLTNISNTAHQKQGQTATSGLMRNNAQAENQYPT